MYKASWIPPINAPAPPWLEKATIWRQNISRLAYVTTCPEAHLNTMDFDEVMEMLDEAATRPDGTRVHQSDPIPSITITNWGRKDGHDFGFFIRNDGTAANDVAIHPPIAIGNYVLGSETLPLLLDQHRDGFLELVIEDDKGIRRGTEYLITLLAALPVTRSGVKVLPLLRVVCKTSNDTWIGSSYELNLDFDKQSVVAYFIKRETLGRS